MDNLTNNGTPVARYLSYTQNRVIMDPSVPFTYMGIEVKILSILKTSLFMGIAHIRDRGYQRSATILKLNVSEFDDMKAKGEYYRVLTDREPISPKYSIVVPEGLSGMDVTDVELLGISYSPFDYPWLAVLV
jgi:hypothetical protein